MRTLSTLVLLMLSTPAWAAGSAVPEPPASALFALGVVGVIVGRHAAKHGRRD
jgi:hypothetical protein